VRLPAIRVHPSRRRTELNHLPEIRGPPQGALGLRAGAPATQTGAGLGSLRGPVLDRPAPARADDLHGFRLAAAPPPRRATPDGVGEKCRVVFRDRYHLQACRPCAAPSWRGYLQILSRPSDVRTADANSGQHLTSDCPGSARCLVAEHCWDPVGLAIVDYAYRFERLGAPASGRG